MADLNAADLDSAMRMIAGTALVLDNSREKVAFCAADMVLMPSSLYEEVTRRVARRAKIPADHILLSASHSHAASGAVYKETRFITGDFNEQRYEQLVEQLAATIAAAASKMVPAKYGAGSGRLANLSANRTPGGGPVDPALNVLRVDRADGSPLAAIVNFAAHPTVLGSGNMEFSADFPGAMRAAMEGARPGLTALYVNGTQGNVSPLPPPGGDGFAAVERMGRRLAEEAQRIYETIETTDRVEILVGQQPVRVVLGPGLEFTTYISQVVLDRDVIIGIPGEAFAEFGLELGEKARAAGFATVFKFGLTNGSIGYLLPRAAWLRHEYESLVSAAGIELGPFIVDTSLKLLEKMRARATWIGASQ